MVKLLTAFNPFSVLLLGLFADGHCVSKYDLIRVEGNTWYAGEGMNHKALPGEWKRLWERKVPGSPGKEALPTRIRSEESLSFGEDYVEYEVDSSFFRLDSQGVWIQYGINLKIGYGKWEIRNDSLILKDGVKIVASDFPGASRRDTTSGFEATGRLKIDYHPIAYKPGKPFQKEFRFLGRVWTERITVGM